jgi:hypothetical protein
MRADSSDAIVICVCTSTVELGSSPGPGNTVAAWKSPFSSSMPTPLCRS